ncbi:MAG: saccharopine dehydrogenase NADP-binding domain-containing protein [Planctomycetes bacterium]|nr:saccharopine dehydrogenase NADP-binding domain-containing protein [Planctomycetota bacterium]
MDRDLDLVLYGATGFTGRVAARYLADHAPPGLRWALAGRDPGKLEALRRDLRPVEDGPEVALLRVDAGDPGAVRDMAARARVVASTAGPFARYSDPVVTACVEAGTDYADITGETPWARRLIERHHARAAAEGTRIVPLCGFDSIPADIGTWMLVDAVREAWDQPVRRVAGAFRLRGGGVNGGTVASALTLAESGDAAALRDPLLLVPPPGRGLVDDRPVRRSAGRDDDLDVWLAPFVMSPINQQVVLRSAALWAERGRAYGPRFAYDEGLELPRVAAVAVSAGMRVGDGLLRSRLGRRLVRRLAPPPGEGPSEAAMAAGHVRLRLIAEAADGRRATGELACPGDPGNRATALFLCEAAMALALDRDALPPGGGVLTPATALGGALLARLRRAGVTATVAVPAQGAPVSP